MTPPGRRWLPDIEFGSAASRVDGLGEVDFVTRPDMKGEKFGDEDAASIREVESHIVTLRFGSRDHATADHVRNSICGVDAHFEAACSLPRL